MADLPDGIDTTIPRGPRVYDYWLGGDSNFPADRMVAEQVLQFLPEILDSVRGNRKFLGRAVAFLRDAGVRQFLDIGCGLPISPNVHEIAQQGVTGARVVYVDRDPEVTSHAAELTAGNDLAAVVRADLRADREVLDGAARLLDFTRPVGLLFAGCLHHIPDSDDPAGVVARYLAALAPGSYLLISQLTGEFARDRMQVNADLADDSGTMLIPRDKDAIARMFNGLPLVDPGLVLVSHWRPENADPGAGADRAWAYGGVAIVQPASTSRSLRNSRLRVVGATARVIRNQWLLIGGPQWSSESWSARSASTRHRRSCSTW